MGMKTQEKYMLSICLLQNASQVLLSCAPTDGRRELCLTPSWLWKSNTGKVKQMQWWLCTESSGVVFSNFFLAVLFWIKDLASLKLFNYLGEFFVTWIVIQIWFLCKVKMLRLSKRNAQCITLVWEYEYAFFMKGYIRLAMQVTISKIAVCLILRNSEPGLFLT